MEVIWQGIVKAIELVLGFDTEVWQITWLSLKISGGATLISLLLGVPLGIALALIRFRGRDVAVALINTAGGKAFADFMVAPQTQNVIKNFGVDKFGQSLFVPVAGKKEEELGV